MQWPKRKWVIVVALAFALLDAPSAATTAAQRPMYFRHLTLQDGLSQNTITFILQDSRGFIWLGSENGLNRYDGHKFVHYHRDRNDPQSLGGEFIWSIAEDQESNLWLATDKGGVARWDRQSDTFKNYRHDPNNVNSLSSNSVRTLIVGKQGQIWIGLSDGGLNVLDPISGRIERLVHDPDNVSSLSSNAVYAIYQDRAGSIWVGTDAGLNLFNQRNRSFLRYQNKPDDPQTLSNDRVRSIYEDHEGALWVGTFGGGLNRLNRLSGRFTQYLADPDNPQALSHNHVRVIFEDDAQRLWVGTADGLNLLDRSTMTAQRFVNDQTQQSLSHSYIMSIHQDRGGLLWVGTRSGGVNVWNPRSWSLGHYTADWLQDTNVTAFASEEEQLWVGTYDHGLVLLDGGIEKKRYGAEALGDDRVMSLILDGQRGLWIGTMGGGLNRLNLASDEIVNYRHDPEDPQSLGSNGVMSLLQDRQGNIWVGTFGGGIGRYNISTKTFDNFSVEHGLTSPRATSIAQDLEGYIWIGTDAGLNRLEPETGEILQYRFDPNNPSSLGADTIYTLHVDGVGTLWIGTAGGGLNRLDHVEGGMASFTGFSQPEGLPSNVVYGIRSDVQGQLWLATNNGLARFNPATGEVKQFHKAHGLQGEEFNFGAHYTSEWGVLYFGGANGFNAIVPTRLQENKHVPAIVLTGLESMNQPLSTVVPYADLTQLGVDYKSSALTFKFAALDYTAPTQNRFSYILEGFDSEWSPPSHVTRATYTNLDAGEYVFRVKGANSDGVWNDEGLSLAITVTPAPWLTVWAYGAYALIFAAIASFIFRAHLLKRRQELQYRRRLYHLAYFDPLTGIANRQMFIRNLQEAIKRAEADDATLALFYLDLDEFKRINDTLGHNAGDSILKAVSKRLQLVVEKTTLAQPRVTLELARLGGDEFVLIACSLKDEKAVDNLAKRISRALSWPLMYKRYELVITPSIGISLYPGDGRSVQALMKNADTALHEAKRAGRNEYKFYSRMMNARALEDLALEGELRRALENDELHMVYQPKVEIASETIVGAEALIRWQHPEKGTISPERFISLAERSGLILEIDRWVVDAVIKQLSAWRKLGLDLVPVAANLSGREFVNKGLVWSLSQAADECDVPPTLLEIEITESVLMSDAEAAKVTVGKLKSMGFHVAVDDFGTGYSSLSYLKSFSVSALKIDRSFVTDLCEDAEDRAICTAIIAMAKGLGIKSIAEGVTSAEQLQYLRAQGCDYVQGYYFYKPQSAEDFQALLQQRMKPISTDVAEMPAQVLDYPLNQSG